jgi:hypothetical protein
MTPAERRALRERHEAMQKALNFDHRFCTETILALLDALDAAEAQREEDKAITAEWANALGLLCDLVPDSVHIADKITDCVEPIKRLVNDLSARLYAAERDAAAWRQALYAAPGSLVIEAEHDRLLNEKETR